MTVRYVEVPEYPEEISWIERVDLGDTGTDALGDPGRYTVAEIEWTLARWGTY